MRFKILTLSNSKKIITGLELTEQKIKKKLYKKNLVRLTPVQKKKMHAMVSKPISINDSK